MNTRMKELRNCLGYSQAEMGEVLGLSKSGISEIEASRRSVTEQHIIMLKNAKFDNGKILNTDWLRTGEGEMFIDVSIDEQIATFIGKIQMDDKNDFKKRFIAMLSKLDESEWEFLEQKAKEIVGYDKKMD